MTITIAKAKATGHRFRFRLRLCYREISNESEIGLCRVAGRLDLFNLLRRIWQQFVPIFGDENAAFNADADPFFGDDNKRLDDQDDTRFQRFVLFAIGMVNIQLLQK